MSTYLPVSVLSCKSPGLTQQLLKYISVYSRMNSPISDPLPSHKTPYNINRVDSTTREVSLTAPPPTNAAGVVIHQSIRGQEITEENFYACIDAQLVKVEAFTLEKVTELRSNISSLENEVKGLNKENDREVERVREKADEVAKSFLILEKYVNINFMGE